MQSQLIIVSKYLKKINRHDPIIPAEFYYLLTLPDQTRSAGRPDLRVDPTHGQLWDRPNIYMYWQLITVLRSKPITRLVIPRFPSSVEQFSCGFELYQYLLNIW